MVATMSSFKKIIREQLWLDTGYWQYVWVFLKVFVVFAAIILLTVFLSDVLGKSEL